MKTKMSFSIITIMVIFVMGCTSPNNGSKTTNNKESQIDSIIRPQDFGNGVFYFDTETLASGYANRTKEFFGKSISHFIQHNPEWKINAISPVLGVMDVNEVEGYFVICEPIKK